MTNEKLTDEMLYQEVYGAQDRLIAEAKELLKNSPARDVVKETILMKLGALGFHHVKEVENYIIEDGIRHFLQNNLSKIEEYKQKYPLNRFIDQASIDKVCEKYGLYLTFASNYIGEIPEKKQKEIVDFTFFENDYRTPRELYRDTWGLTSLDLSGGPSQKVGGRSLCIMAPEEKINSENLVKDGRILRTNDPIVLQPVNGGRRSGHY